MSTKNNSDYLKHLNLGQLLKGNQSPTVDDYKKAQKDACSGPLFTAEVLAYVDTFDRLSKPVVKWLPTTMKGRTKPTNDGLRSIDDWVRGGENVDLTGLTYKKALDAQEKWHKETFVVQQLGDYETHDVVYRHGDQMIVELHKAKDFRTEGDLMGHCVGGEHYVNQVRNGTVRMFSLRDKGNKPHATIEFDPKNRIVKQCYGKQNTKPKDEYQDALCGFMDHIDCLLWTNTIDKSPNWDRVLAALAERKDKDSQFESSVAHEAHNRKAPYEVLLAIVNTSTEAAHVLAQSTDNQRLLMHLVRTYSDLEVPSDEELGISASA